MMCEKEFQIEIIEARKTQKVRQSKTKREICKRWGF